MERLSLTNDSKPNSCFNSSHMQTKGKGESSSLSGVSWLDYLILMKGFSFFFFQGQQSTDADEIKTAPEIIAELDELVGFPI